MANNAQQTQEVARSQTAQKARQVQIEPVEVGNANRTRPPTRWDFRNRQYGPADYQGLSAEDLDQFIKELNAEVALMNAHPTLSGKTRLAFNKELLNFAKSWQRSKQMKDNAQTKKENIAREAAAVAGKPYEGEPAPVVQQPKQVDPESQYKRLALEWAQKLFVVENAVEGSVNKAKLLDETNQWTKDNITTIEEKVVQLHIQQLAIKDLNTLRNERDGKISRVAPELENIKERKE